MLETIVVGGGAAGFFAAIRAAEFGPVVLLEKTNQLLSKVKISGGGRCNVTHACFEPKKLVEYYPRGKEELLSCFHRFQPKDTMEWFETRGVPLKIEEDGRIFPTTDSSASIIESLMQEAKERGVDIRLQSRIESIQNGFTVKVNGIELHCQKLILATGSQSAGHSLAKNFGHTIIPPVPSLFTFNIPDSPLLPLSGISMDLVQVKIFNWSFQGPLLLTHWGFSGPAILKASAFAARKLHECDYQTQVEINWVPGVRALEILNSQKKTNASKALGSLNPFKLPKGLWRTFLELLEIPPIKQLAHLTHDEMEKITRKLEKDTYHIKGKTTYKEEFVTAGGIKLKEVNFKTMESKIVPGLFFAGEILDIDGVTGGFNFQNAWTTGWIAGTHLKG